MKEYLIVLAGGLRQDKNGTWHTTLGENQSSENGLLNDRLRVLAAEALWKDHNDSIILSSGGQGTLKDILPAGLTPSKVIKDELIELGVQPECIIEENKTATTYEQLISINEMIKSGALSGKVKIISNNYHLPRIEAMINYTKLKNDLSGHIELVGAEDVLMKYKKAEWEDFIEKAEKSEVMVERLKNEAKGVEQIKNGTYKFE